MVNNITDIMFAETEFKNILTDGDGLKKLVDFLESPGNTGIGGEENLHINKTHQIFYIKSMKSAPIETNVKPTQYKDFIKYSVNIGTKHTPSTVEKHVGKLTDVIKEIYKG